MDNKIKNKDHYNRRYAAKRESIINNLSPAKFRASLEDWKRRNSMGYAMLYFDGLEEHLPGSRILELGFGDGKNSLLMAQFGAEVLSVEISEKAVENLNFYADKLGLTERIHAVCGELNDLQLEECSFDFVIGNAFLHHLTESQEQACLAEVSRLIKPMGEARFVDPAQNFLLLEWIKHAIPVHNRPSIFSRHKFREFKDKDPHPKRPLSSQHFRTLGKRYFNEVEIVPWGALQRFSRFVPYNMKWFWVLNSVLMHAEIMIPTLLHMIIARTQTIMYRKPRRE